MAFQAGAVICLDLPAMQAEAARAGPVPVVAPVLKLFLIAGEPSGDRLGAALMAGLRAT